MSNIFKFLELLPIILLVYGVLRFLMRAFFSTSTRKAVVPQRRPKTFAERELEEAAAAAAAAEAAEKSAAAAHEEARKPFEDTYEDSRKPFEDTYEDSRRSLEEIFGHPFSVGEAVPEGPIEEEPEEEASAPESRPAVLKASSASSLAKEAAADDFASRYPKGAAAPSDLHQGLLDMFSEATSVQQALVMGEILRPKFDKPEGA